MENFIEVFYKENYGEKKARGIKSRLESAGLKNITEVIPSTIYKVEGDYNKEQIKTLAQNLLTDPVLETYKTGIENPKGYVKAQVWIRDSSTDVVGESVKDAIAALGQAAPRAVRVCNAFAVKGTFKKSELETAVKKTFVNEVVNKFEIEEFR
jgi:phosphoribosylformylglycinamidine (FGAM) synthase PurS component